MKLILQFTNSRKPSICSFAIILISKSQKIEAERLRLALMYGCEEAVTVIAWADQIIQEQKKPYYLFIKLSLTRPEKKQRTDILAPENWSGSRP